MITDDTITNISYGSNVNFYTDNENKCQNNYRRGFYHIDNTCYKYLSTDDTANCN